MFSLLPQVMAFVSIPVLALIGGGVIAAFRPPSLRLQSMFQHFAAGLVFAAVAAELLPDLLSKHAPLATIIGFSLGTALMLTVKWLTKKFEGKEEDKKQEPETFSLVAVVGVDIAIDGLLIGIGFAAGQKEGILLTIALAIELLSLGLATSGTLSNKGLPRKRSILTITGLGIMPVIGAVIGATLLSGLSGGPFEAVIAFGVAALLYLVTEELLTEAHEVPETPFTTATFFLGFLTLLVINLSA